MIMALSSFIVEFLKLLDGQCAQTVAYSPLKINFFAGVHLKATIINNDNQFLVIETIKALFKLIERLIDSEPLGDKSKVKRVVEKILILPLLFCQTEFKGKNRLESYFSYFTDYSNFQRKKEADFDQFFLKKGSEGKFLEKSPAEIESGFIKFYEKLKRRIDIENRLLDPVQVMALGREESMKKK
jgi:hypothetical protein